jgi:hypothetical protein
MNILLSMIYAIWESIDKIYYVLLAILGIMVFNLLRSLYYQFNLREKLTKVKGGLCRRLNNLDIRLVNFLDNRE